MPRLLISRKGKGALDGCKWRWPRFHGILGSVGVRDVRGKGMIPRIATAVIAIPVVLYVIYVGGGLLALMVAVAAAVCGWEFSALVKAGGVNASADTIAGGAVLLVGISYLDDPVLSQLGVIAVVFYGLIRRGFGEPDSRLCATATSVLGALYTGLSLGYIISIRHLPGAGFELLLLFVVTVWAFDSFAYFCGISFGRRRLWERISPRKSWEGAVGGVAGAVLTASGLALLLRLAPGPSAVLALVIAISSQVGDLIESALKRAADVKDSGRVLPGHGGLLDRLDSMMFAAPVTYFLLKYVVQLV